MKGFFGKVTWQGIAVGAGGLILLSWVARKV